jgi:hypothetical protein
VGCYRRLAPRYEPGDAPTLLHFGVGIEQEFGLPSLKHRARGGEDDVDAIIRQRLPRDRTMLLHNRSLGRQGYRLPNCMCRWDILMNSCVTSNRRDPVCVGCNACRVEEAEEVAACEPTNPQWSKPHRPPPSNQVLHHYPAERPRRCQGVV